MRRLEEKSQRASAGALVMKAEGGSAGVWRWESQQSGREMVVEDRERSSGNLSRGRFSPTRVVSLSDFEAGGK